ncbi:pentatricopeptide repeat-containing protein At3g13880 [Cryptomeria japonica]|uniref:pentatricopeptide repeat-containing protein At3g13880 n=1 Tax=Cryptomeria japonica TaxID=3369 RepID=UPI0027D9E26D|nr:pentatricopeptide repeat-containing protein At3g13880 [Cryptomeria japonica]
MHLIMDHLNLTSLVNSVTAVLKCQKYAHVVWIASFGTKIQSLAFGYHGSCARIEDYREEDSTENEQPKNCYDSISEHVSNLCRNGPLLVDSNTYTCLLQECVKSKALEGGQRIHTHMIKTGFKPCVFLQTNLVNMYAKCGSLEDARQVLDKIPKPDIVSWNSLISGYAQYGHYEDVQRQFWQMRKLGMNVDHFTFATMLSACAKLGDLRQGKQIHTHIIRTGFRSQLFVSNALVDMYAKCGRLEEAHIVFDEASERDGISWNALITGYAQNGHDEETLKLFGQMQQLGLKPTFFTFGSILKACGDGGIQERGKVIHAYIIKTGFETDVFVGSAIVDMYAKCRAIADALKVFHKMPARNVATYNVIIAGVIQIADIESSPKYGEDAINVFIQMQRIAMKPNHFTFTSILGACSRLAFLEHGKQVHAHIIKGKLESNEFVGSALVDMYAKCGAVEDAWKWFSKMPKLDIVSWTAMISGYVQNGQCEEALEFFCQIIREGVKPDHLILCTVLSASAILAGQEQGRQIHAYSIKTGYESLVVIGNSLIDMYSKCGSIDDAGTFFGTMFKRDVVSWSVLISGYAQHGRGKEALQLFAQMQEEGTKPNHITFVGVLSACSHVGLVDEGYRYFNSMIRDHGIEPKVEHCACIVDLLGRAGRMDEAEHFINEMGVESNAVVWRTLLAASRIHGNLDLGKRAAEHIIELEPHTSGTYVLLSNIYASVGRLDDARKVRNMMRDRGLKKQPGLSWIEVNNIVNCFTVRV